MRVRPSSYELALLASMVVLLGAEIARANVLEDDEAMTNGLDAEVDS